MIGLLHMYDILSMRGSRLTLKTFLAGILRTISRSETYVDYGVGNKQEGLTKQKYYMKVIRVKSMENYEN
ncbi:hypothetical protein CR513_62674, partial [Mucuna pruriens]